VPIDEAGTELYGFFGICWISFGQRLGPCRVSGFKGRFNYDWDGGNSQLPHHFVLGQKPVLSLRTGFIMGDWWSVGEGQADWRRALGNEETV
jgi:hypothetical protein